MYFGFSKDFKGCLYNNASQFYAHKNEKKNKAQLPPIKLA